MNDTFDIYTILFLVIAVVVILRLRSVLGRKTGNEQSAAERMARANEAAREKVVPMPRAETPTARAKVAPPVEDGEARVSDSIPVSNPAHGGLVEIANNDPAFEPKSFLQGARAAYEMIVVGFAEGNRPLLKKLLSREVYDGFATAISEREDRGEAVETKFVGIDKADIIEADLVNKTARVTIKFVSQLITAVKDRAGAIIDGDPKQIREVTDIWTFAREVSSKDPNWRLVATQSAN